MLERGTILRGFFVLALLAAACSALYGMLSNTDGTSGNFLDDGDKGWRYGPIYDEPTAVNSLINVNRWVRELPVRGGTYASKLPLQERIAFAGSGPIPEREVALESPAAVRLFSGDRRDRAEDVLRGIQRTLEERQGLIRALVLTDSTGGAQAAAMSSIIHDNAADSFTDPRDRRIVERLLVEASRDVVANAWAWYNPRGQDIVLGTKISSGLRRWINTPDESRPEQNIFTAHVLLHELEHSITPSTSDENYARVQWIEEGGADTLARWPGAAANMARELGMTYPKRYEKRAYEPKDAGYPEWVETVRVLLKASGIDVKDPAQIDDATELLQGKDASAVPGLIAARIASRNRLTPGEQARLARDIRALDGDVRAAKRLVARY